MRQPCNNCPWRRDSPAGYWHPDHFTKIWTGCQDDGRDIMLCHKATALPEDEQRDHVCQGWVRVLGLDAVGVRIAVLRERITDEELADSDRPDLYDSFEEMLDANGIPLPKRNKAR